MRDLKVGDRFLASATEPLPDIPMGEGFGWEKVSRVGDATVYELRDHRAKQVIMCDDPGREFSTWDKTKPVDDLQMLKAAIETVHENGPDPRINPDRPALTANAQARKNTPLFSGCLAYFPLALAAVAALSQIGNEQHNPGTELHWDRSKSGDEWDALTRHLLEVGSYDTDGVRHATKVAWRALAGLQKELEQADDSSHRSTLHSPHYGGAAEDPGPGC